MSPHEPPTARILSIDGGGVRGVVSLEVLRAIEARVGCLRSHFDYVIGSGVGAVTAAGVAHGLAVDQVDELFFEELSQTGMNRRNREFEAGRAVPARIDEMFGDARLSELRGDVPADLRMPLKTRRASCHFAVPLVNVEGRDVELMATHRADAVRRDLRVADILRASLSRGARGRSGVALENGRKSRSVAARDPIGRGDQTTSVYASAEDTSYNNPAAVAVQMARDARPAGCGWGDAHQIVVVSLGNGRIRHTGRTRSSLPWRTVARSGIASLAASDWTHVVLARESGSDSAAMHRWSHDEWAWAEPGVSRHHSARLHYVRIDASLDSTTMYRHGIVASDSRAAEGLVRRRVQKHLRSTGKALGREVAGIPELDL